MFFWKKSNTYTKIPMHMAFIMDGNGRWAQKRGMPRTYGHRKGVDALIKVIEECENIGVKVVSFFVFSTENWKRPKEEIDYIFNLAKELFSKNRLDYEKKNYKFFVSGDVTKLDNETQNVISSALDDTKSNTGLKINFAINYGGRDEIVNACKSLQDKGLEITKENFEKELYTAELPDPDIVVRSSGELRISNFMLYQMAYSEFFFPKKYWPDFNGRDVHKILKAYQTRNRRYGKIK